MIVSNNFKNLHIRIIGQIPSIIQIFFFFILIFINIYILFLFHFFFIPFFNSILNTHTHIYYITYVDSGKDLFLLLLIIFT